MPGRCRSSVRLYIHIGVHVDIGHVHVGSVDIRNVHVHVGVRRVHVYIGGFLDHRGAVSVVIRLLRLLTCEQWRNTEQEEQAEQSPHETPPDGV